MNKKAIISLNVDLLLDGGPSPLVIGFILVEWFTLIGTFFFEWLFVRSIAIFGMAG
jgi:hypothetical protein